MTVTYLNPISRSDQAELAASSTPHGSGGLASQVPGDSPGPQVYLGQAARAAGVIGFDTRVWGGWLSLLGRVKWTYFVTLTLDPKRYARSGVESWVSAVRWFVFRWCMESAVLAGLAVKDGDGFRGPYWNAWRRGVRPQWVLGLEPHRDGRLHVHLLLLLAGRLKRLDYEVGEQLWWEQRGVSHFERPRSQEHVTQYVGKYVLKGGSDGLVLSDNFDAPKMTDLVAAHSRYASGRAVVGPSSPPGLAVSAAPF